MHKREHLNPITKALVCTCIHSLRWTNIHATFSVEAFSCQKDAPLSQMLDSTGNQIKRSFNIHRSLASWSLFYPPFAFSACLSPRIFPCHDRKRTAWWNKWDPTRCNMPFLLKPRQRGGRKSRGHSTKWEATALPPVFPRRWPMWAKEDVCTRSK